MYSSRNYLHKFLAASQIIARKYYDTGQNLLHWYNVEGWLCNGTSKI